MGMRYMAATRTAVRKAAGVSVLYAHLHRYHGRRATLHNEKYLPHEQSPPGFLRSASRGAVRVSRFSERNKETCIQTWS